MDRQRETDRQTDRHTDKEARASRQAGGCRRLRVIRERTCERERASQQKSETVREREKP